MKKYLAPILTGGLVVIILVASIWAQNRIGEGAGFGNPGDGSGLVDLAIKGLLVVLGLALYFLPTIVAGRSDHPHFGGISLLNLLLGWTVLGWIVALVWAATKPERSAAPPAATTSPSVGRCPDCGGMVSIHAEACPHCGRPRNVPAKEPA